MFDTGIIRKLDDLGRVTIPSEIRTNFEYKENQLLDIYITDKNVITATKFVAGFGKGLVRKVDELGRIVIPSEMRKNLKLTENQKLSFYTDGEGTIFLKKYKNTTNKDMMKRILHFTYELYEMDGFDNCVLKANKEEKEYLIFNYRGIDLYENSGEIAYKDKKAYLDKIDFTKEELNERQHQLRYIIDIYEFVFFSDKKLNDKEIKKIEYILDLI